MRRLIPTAANHRIADATALAAVAFALVALLAIGTPLFFEPILVSLQGPDPCGGAKGVRQPDKACVFAHPEYYEYDPATGSLYSRGQQISQTVDAVAWPAAVALALVAAVISWRALAMGTGRRRIAVSVLTLSSLIVVGVGFWFLVLFFGPGD